ncbi:MAG: hypothetical protein LBR31_07865 [Desulfovibrio sp.]|jgi:hypothetical protein|nr:hypothetical protein [Desulfovibrio sp.]
MKPRNPLPLGLAFLLALSLYAPLSARAADSAGEVLSAIGVCKAVRAGLSRNLSKGDAVNEEDALSTGKDARLPPNGFTTTGGITAKGKHMAKWITTTWYSVNYGWDYESKGGVLAAATERFFTPEEKLRNSLNEMIAYLDSNQYTIKAIIPKTLALACVREGSIGNGGYGWGYGVTPITGFVVLAQQEREVTDEEYKRLSRAQAMKNALPAMREKCGKLQQAVDADGKKVTDTSEKKKLLGGVKYFVGEQEFDSREEAEAFLGAMQAECAAKRAELEEAQAELARMESELKGLEA